MVSYSGRVDLNLATYRLRLCQRELRPADASGYQVVSSHVPLTTAFDEIQKFDSINQYSHLLELLVCCELDGTIGDDAQTVDTVTAHEALEAFLLPHAHEAAPYATVRLVG